MPCCTVPCSALQCGAVQYNVLQCNIMWCSAVQHSAMQCHCWSYRERWKTFIYWKLYRTVLPNSGSVLTYWTKPGPWCQLVTPLLKENRTIRLSQLWLTHLTENWCRSTRMCDICMHFVKQSDYITNLTSCAAWVQARFMSFYLFLLIYFFSIFFFAIFSCYVLPRLKRGSWKGQLEGEKLWGRREQ